MEITITLKCPNCLIPNIVGKRKEKKEKNFFCVMIVEGNLYVSFSKNSLFFYKLLNRLKAFNCYQI